MNQSWDWIAPVRKKHFAEPLAGGFALRPVENAEIYWKRHEQCMREHFPPEVFFNFSALRGEQGQAAQQRLNQCMSANRLEDFWIVQDDDEVIMMCSGHQVDERLYRMWHSHVHPKYRRLGLYREYLRRVIAYTADLGFEAIISEHAPNNNAVIIAKLRAGFRIFSMEIDPALGVSVCLRYFHEPAHLAAYEFRCGYATLNEHLLAHGHGAMPLLVRQIKMWGKE